MVVVIRLLFVVVCCWFNACFRCLLFVDRWFVVCYSLFVGRCSLFVVRCVLCVVCCDVRSSLFVVRCSSFVVARCLLAVA